MSDSNTSNQASSMGRNLLWAGGGAALVGLGLAAGIMMRKPADAPNAEAPTAAASEAMSPASAALMGNNATAQAEAPKATQHHKEATHHHSNAEAGQAVQTGQPAPAAQVCATCGTVDSVRAVQQKGEGSGVGAVAGGVLGGLAGNQMGKGSGKTAMTVLGAIGGGLAGNEVEKRQRAETVYEVTVRMDDGSTRTFTQKTAPDTGSRVEVEGNSLRSLNR